MYREMGIGLGMEPTAFLYIWLAFFTLDWARQILAYIFGCSLLSHRMKV